MTNQKITTVSILVDVLSRNKVLGVWVLRLVCDSKLTLSI